MNDTAGFVENLILVRLLAASQKPPGAKQIEKDLYRCLDDRLAPGEWTSQLEQAVDRLVEGGELLRRPFRLTDSGRQRALDFLQLEDLPARVTWAQLRDQYLMALAFDLPPSAKQAREGIKDLNRLRGMVLKQEHALDATVDYPSCKQSVDAMAWRALGVETSAEFTPPNVVRHLLGQDLDSRSRLKPEQLRNQLVAQTLGAHNTDAGETRWAVLRRWAGQQVGSQPRQLPPTASESRLREPPPAPVGAGEPAAGADGTLELSEFARRVLDAARSSPSGRFGEQKVFISHVWQRFRERDPQAGESFERFQSRLAQANQQGLLSLSRADLVAAMDPSDVAASETRHLNATFHFVQI